MTRRTERGDANTLAAWEEIIDTATMNMRARVSRRLGFRVEPPDETKREAAEAGFRAQVWAGKYGAIDAVESVLQQWEDGLMEEAWHREIYDPK